MFERERIMGSQSKIFHPYQIGALDCHGLGINFARNEANLHPPRHSPRNRGHIVYNNISRRAV